jgi:fucokinase
VYKRQRQHEVTTALAELADCARSAAAALAEGDLDRLAPLIREVWGLHQRLDPHCSNPKVDALLRHAAGDDAQAWKLAGAGGGGFAGILCPDGAAAERVRVRLRAAGNGVLVPAWSLHTQTKTQGGSGS